MMKETSFLRPMRYETRLAETSGARRSGATLTADVLVLDEPRLCSGQGGAL